MDEHPRARTMNPGNFANNHEKAVEAGRRGGKVSRGGGGAENNPGNFANNRNRAAEAGRKGGSAVRGTVANRP